VRGKDLSAMAIPKLIVQTHKNDIVGADYRQTWIEKHPDYEYRFIDDEGCINFFEKFYPQLLNIYNKLPMEVQKADLFRYAYIYHYGGTYADVDTVCFAPLDSYININKEQLVVGVEMTPFNYKEGLTKYVLNYCSPFQILQWTFAASPKHPALAIILDKIRFMVNQLSPKQLSYCSKSKRFTLELTGPMLFTAVTTDFLSKTRNGSVTVLDQLCWGYSPWGNNIHLPHPKVKVQHLFDSKWKMKVE